MNMAQNDSVNERSKHIEVKYHFIKHHVQICNVKFKYISTAFADRPTCTK